METPKPGGLGKEFAQLLSVSVVQALGKDIRIPIRMVVVVYSPPKSSEVAKQIESLISTRLKDVFKGVSHAIGVNVAPVLEVDYRVTEKISLKGLANEIEKALPLGGWALIIVHRVFPRPSPLAATSTQYSSSTALTPNYTKSSTRVSKSHVIPGQASLTSNVSTENTYAKQRTLSSNRGQATVLREPSHSRWIAIATLSLVILTFVVTRFIPKIRRR